MTKNQAFEAFSSNLKINSKNERGYIVSFEDQLLIQEGKTSWVKMAIVAFENGTFASCKINDLEIA